jgi:hypothetical protein
VVAASGPSLTEADCELVRAAGVPLLVINDSWRLAPWAPYLYACDGRWWDAWAEDTAKGFEGERWTQDVKAAKRYGLQYIESKARIGLGSDCIHQGRNSGYQAINLGFLWGFRNIALIGYDMSAPAGKTHFFGSHSRGSLIDAPRYEDYCDAFEQMRPQEHGLTVINCSRHTALRSFAREPLENVLERHSAGAALPARRVRGRAAKRGAVA